MREHKIGDKYRFLKNINRKITRTTTVNWTEGWYGSTHPLRPIPFEAESPAKALEAFRRDFKMVDKECVEPIKVISNGLSFPVDPDGRLGDA